MHSAIFVVEREPAMDHIREQSWLLAMAEMREILKTTDQVQSLAESVFLIPLHSDLSTLSLLISICLKYRGMSYRVLFLKESPDWITRPTR